MPALWGTLERPVLAERTVVEPALSTRCGRSLVYQTFNAGLQQKPEAVRCKNGLGVATVFYPELVAIKKRHRDCWLAVESRRRPSRKLVKMYPNKSV